MKNVYRIIFLPIMTFSTQSILQGAFLQQLVETHEARGTRVTTKEQRLFENQAEKLSQQIAASPQPTQISEDNADQVSMVINSFYTLFFDPALIRFSTKEIINDFFDQLTAWHDALKNSTITIPWPEGNRGENLKKLLVQGLKEICLFGRYTKHKEENLVTFKLRLQRILTSIMMDSSLALWKNELVNNNEQLSLGAFYSWDVAFIKSEFKDSAALIPLFNKLSTTIDVDGEQQAAKQHQQELALEKQQLAQRKEQEAQYLRAIVLHIEQQSPTDDAAKETLYLDYIRALLDPAYMDLSPKERKSIDTIKDQFKKLHEALGKKFVPVLSQNGIDTLKLLVAKALEIIYSPAAGRIGGVAFKNHIEFVLKTIMAIEPNQKTIENQIKFQWIKPLYFDNQFLTADLKKKLLGIFNNDNFQRWQASIRNFTFKVASPIVAPSIAPILDEAPEVFEPIATTEAVTKNIIAPIPPITRPVEEEEIFEETLSLSPSMQQKKAQKEAELQAKKDLKERNRLFKAKREQTKAAEKQAREEAQKQIQGKNKPLKETQQQTSAAQKLAQKEARQAAQKQAREETKAKLKEKSRLFKEKKEQANAAKQEAQEQTREATLIPTMPVTPSPAPAVSEAPAMRAPKIQEPTAPSANLQQIGANLIAQALVAPIDVIKNTVATIQPEQKFDVISTTDNMQYTAVHSAASLGRADVIEVLLKNLTPNERFAIITMREKDGQTPLHLAASAPSKPTQGFRPVNAVNELLKGLTQQQQIELITMKDNSGATASDIARGLNKAVDITLREKLNARK